MTKVAEYKVRALDFPAELAKQVTRRRAEGESIAAIAKEMGIGTGKAAMAELVGTTERVTHEDPAVLARAIAKDRKAGKAWGWLAARYGVTEGTARAAYVAATGQPWQTIDYRRTAGKEA
jgi:hypothetical protein